MTKNATAARKAIDKRNAQAAKVERLREQLWKAEQALKDSEKKAWSVLPDDGKIRLGKNEPWEFIG